MTWKRYRHLWGSLREIHRRPVDSQRANNAELWWFSLLPAGTIYWSRLLVIWGANTFVYVVQYHASDTITGTRHCIRSSHDDVIKWKLFPRYWTFVREIHQWRGALMFSMICAKQPRRRWLETPSSSLLRHCNDKQSHHREYLQYRHNGRDGVSNH